MAIPTSNKPGEKNADPKGDKKADKKVDVTKDEAFQKKVSDTIAQIKPMVDEVESVITQAEETKIVSIYKVGEQMNKLLADIGVREKKLIVKRFHKEIGMHESFFYLAMQISECITQTDLNAMKKNGVTLQALKALVTIKDEKIKAKALKKAITEGITADEIRQEKGTKGARRVAYAKRKRDNDKKKPPMRVFSQGLDRVLMVQEVIGSCTDAVGRLAECKTEDDRVAAVKVLVEVRKKVPDVINELNAFMKFTANVSKPAKSK